MSVKCFKHSRRDCDECMEPVSRSLTMSEVKHTPGPWKWVLVKHEGAIDCHTLEGPMVLCRFWGGERNVDADAALIASAPELAADLVALRAQLTAALVEIQGLRSALEVTHRIALQFSDAKIGTANWTDARHDFMGQMMVNQKVFEESPNASAGERVRRVLEAAKAEVDTHTAPAIAPNLYQCTCELCEALAALKEADRG